MKVIDLLNKIANGEETPIIKFKLNQHRFKYNKKDEMFDDIDDYSRCKCSIEFCELNNEVEIIENEDINIQDIGELTYKGEKIGYGSTEQFTDDVDDYCPVINSILDSVGIKINEIIRAVKQLEKTKEDK